MSPSKSSTADHSTNQSSHYRLDNPWQPNKAELNKVASSAAVPTAALSASADEQTPTQYHAALERAENLLQKQQAMGGALRVQQQHAKGRMTVLERLAMLSEQLPNLMFQNWGAALDGASIVTALTRINGRDVAVYGHDFTQRAGSMDATNGRKLARLFEMAAQNGIPVIGMNDSAGAFIPSGVGGLDGYAEAFTAMRRISGVVPVISLMFGFNAGGGAYLPRQGSYLIQPENTFFGLTGPDVVRENLGEQITAEALGGPLIHSASGVCDLIAENEGDALRLAKQLLNYLPDNPHCLAPTVPCSEPIEGYMESEAMLFENIFAKSAQGFSTPFDMLLYLQQLVDYGHLMELQPTRAPNIITAYGRIGGTVVGLVANNSLHYSGSIDVAAAQKATRFIRFCNLYNIPMIFIEDVTGFTPGTEQEQAGIVQAGRALLDAIVDLRVPRLTMIVRNAFGGAYASYNNYATGADAVFALPSARIAVMGPAGKQFVYKDEYREILQQYAHEVQANPASATKHRDERLQKLNVKYESELMNPEEALKLGSVSRLVMPGYSRETLGTFLSLRMRHYKPTPMAGTQRE